MSTSGSDGEPVHLAATRLTVTTVVPEPSTLVLVVGALAAMLARRAWGSICVACTPHARRRRHVTPTSGDPSAATRAVMRSCNSFPRNTSIAQPTSSRSPYQTGVALCGPMVMPAAARRALIGANGEAS